MDYFNFIPFELIEQILPYLSKDDLLSFISFYDVKDKLNWNIIYSLHLSDYLINPIKDRGASMMRSKILDFNKIKKNINYNEYMYWLSLEKLKGVLKLEYSIEELNDLKILNLDDNKLTEIPKEIGNLANLKFLSFNKNKLTYIPKEISNLVNLKYLYLNKNNLKEIPAEIAKLNKLEELCLSNNRLTKIPKEIGNLSELKKLDLSSNHLTEIPKEIAGLNNLKFLNLYNNEITEIPNYIGNLKNLQVLNLSNNSLVSVEKEKIKIKSLLPNTEIYL